MADAPKAQRQRRRRNAGTSSAVPTADTTPSGPTGQGSRPRRRTRRARRSRAVRTIVEDTVVVARPRFGGRRFTRAVKRELRREGLEGPKVSVQQKITATFGMVRPNTTGNIELELNFFLHPSLAKEANDGTAFGPLQALAAQYSLWRLKYLTVRFTPMVGASAVSGTVVRTSLNLSQSPGVSNWSGLGARVHVDMHPGQTSVFHLRADQVAGPRDGGWWFTDTNEEGSQSAGPIVEVHTMGETKSTFKDESWTGPLFLVEGIGVWQFANYNVKPALGALERREGVTGVEIKASAAQPITMVMDSTEAVAMFMDSAEPESAAVPTGQSVGETIFQIVDVGAKVAQNIAPAPFGWLIKGGWWFVKKLLGRTRAGTSEYVVYASLQDAQNNKPAVATATLPFSKQTTDLMVTQINSPNVGPNPYTTGTPRGGPQTLKPGESFKVSSEMITQLFVKVSKGQTTGASVAVPVTAIPGVVRDSATGSIIAYPSTATISSKPVFVQTPWWVGVPGMAPGEAGLIPPSPAEVADIEYLPTNGKGGYIHSLYRLHDPRFTDQSGTFEFAPPEVSDDNAEFCLLANFGGGTIDSSGVYTPGPGTGKISRDHPYKAYGKVVATSYIFSGTDPALDMVFSLIKVTKGFTFGGDNVRDLIIAVGTDTNKIAFTYVPPNKGGSGGSDNLPWNLFELDLPVDTWLLAVGYTNAVGKANGADTTTFIKLGTYSRVENTTSAIFPYNLSGQMLPATSIDASLRYVEFHPPAQELIDSLEFLRVPYVLPPHLVEESGKPGPSSGGEGGRQCVPCVLPPIDEEDDSSSEGDSDDSENSVERFFYEIGNEMISLPKKWLNDPEFSRFMDM